MTKPDKLIVLKVKTNISAGWENGKLWWLYQCFRDHRKNLYNCCVSGATPSGCSTCLENCIIDASHNRNGNNYDYDDVYNCAIRKKCFGEN